MEILGIPFEFLLFVATLIGIALFHHQVLRIAVTGLLVITSYKLVFTGFHAGQGLAGFAAHLGHEWLVIANLFLLLVGFALLSRHFEESRLPEEMPAILPDDWRGGFVLLVIIFVLSAFLDNIAAAIIGGTIAAKVFRGHVHVGYLAAIVAAANAGGAGSVVGDTTTTMMWIAGASPLDVLHAYIAAVPALVFFGVIAARQQHRLMPIVKDPTPGLVIDWARVGVVILMLASAIAANVVCNLYLPELLDRLPVLGLAIWAALLATMGLRRPDWSVVPEAAKGAVFLLSLVLAASLMPVDRLPDAEPLVAFGLGFVSAVFDNIPLTALAIRQNGYDWGVLAYAVGFGGSMIWFGSSAGVALSTSFPAARSVGTWVRQGWHVIVGYALGFAVLMLVWGWVPHVIGGSPG